MIADVAQLYGALAPRLESIVRRDVRAPAVVIEDACQAAWFQLIRHAERVEQDAALSWLASTAVHEAVRLARRDRREASLEARAEKGCELNVPDMAPGPYEQAEVRERLELLRDLPKRQQRLLWLKGVGLSYEEIAAQAGLTRRAVERQIHKGRTRLRAAA